MTSHEPQTPDQTAYPPFNDHPARQKRLYLAVFLVSSGLMLYELLLIRLFSVLIWYHFAFMAISLALLGLAVSGIFVFASAGVT